MKLSIEITASDGDARTGVVRTARGAFRTPVFMPVGTRGTVRAVTTADMERLGAEIVLGNTYHLMLKPGADTVAALGGLHGFTTWSGHMLTDSGGYQVFSLKPKVDDDGVTFRSTYDGSTHRLTPEDAVRTQELLGADIQMALDVCTALPASRSELRLALDRTIEWAGRARRAHRRVDDQALFGIVQGGTEPDLRAESAKRTVDLDFDGYAVGGLSVGEPRDVMLPALSAAVEHLPADQPRYFMGLGDPVGIVEAVALGVDMMDCVLPTRLGRHGTLLTSSGRVNIKRAEFARSDEPIDPACGCEVCGRYSRGYLRHLMSVGEPTASTLCTLHNVAWLLAFVDSIRAAIESGTLDRLRAATAEVWA
ncbi:MAG: tRNA guanosine(34) transglycosylase Tgt [Microthrixaceae bacterium]|nr:tRNA guanosine(34) transglycosylase Tgt [Microthrixaceae bacterium]HMS12013.1 tRNA guanosine(34) transglycosylase Tgt [Microthrixaceae bacterium]HMT26197.1 tRNA guanosine(34) transglycosylase Tgt [Microthrixaceae bacterium]HMT61122.1 tRNA guanosine(34) transglycosylase Tgt [Microthrixaceae bacterium]